MASAPREEKTSNSDLWEDEYKIGGIPSSVRDKPSNVVVDFLKFTRTQNAIGTHALDIGAGTGRNSFYLAKQGFSVTAIDYASSQVDAINNKAAHAEKLSVTGICHDITQPWPLPSGFFDLVVDCFCFKHQIHQPAVANYIDELHRTMKSGGLYLLFLAGRDDGYYKQFPISGQAGVGQVIRDPANKIASRLYNIDEIEKLFGRFNVLKAVTKPGENEMHGKLYRRNSHVFYMTKP